MAVSDPVADMLTKVRNASQAKHEKVDISNSKLTSLCLCGLSCKINDGGLLP